MTSITQQSDSFAARLKRSRVFRALGPGLITGAADDDPSGIATYSQAGAQFGFAITWTLLFTYPLMAVIQEISARIGRTTGKGIAANIRQHYPNAVLQCIVFLLVIANTINIGADLGAMADALRLLIGGPMFLYVFLFGIFCASLEVFIPYSRYVSFLKWLTFALFAYFGTAIAVKVPWARSGAGLFHSHTVKQCRLLDGRRCDLWNDYQSLSFFLAGVSRGRRNQKREGEKAVGEIAGTRTRCN